MGAGLVVLVLVALWECRVVRVSRAVFARGLDAQVGGYLRSAPGQARRHADLWPWGAKGLKGQEATTRQGASA